MIGDVIKRLRKQKGISQADLAESINVSQAAIASWEGGSRRPDLDTVLELARFFDVTTDYLLGNVRNEEDDELWSFREECRRDPERRRLFKVAKYGSLNQVKQADAIINALAATNPDYYDGDDPA